MSVLGYVFLAVAVAFIASAVLVLWLADRAPVGEPDRSQLDEWDAQAAEAVELANEQARRDWCQRMHPVNDKDDVRELLREVGRTSEGQRMVGAVLDRYGLTEETAAWLRDRRSS